MPKNERRMIEPDMVRFRILEDALVFRETRQLVSGVVFLDFGDFQFPEADWNDSAVVLAGWWLRAASDLVKGRASRVELSFMEGPFSISLEKAASDRCLIRCQERGKDSPDHEADAALPELLESLLQASRRLLDACERQGWRSADIDTLRAEIAALPPR